ncbi:MAG: ATP-binding protein [Chitinophagales bacterium]
MTLFISTQILSANNGELEFRHLQIEDGLPSSTVYTMMQDSEGYMWFGTDIGLSRYDGYRFVNYTIKDGLPSNDILELAEDSKGRIWMMSLGTLAYYQNDEIHLVDTLPGLMKTPIESLLIDAHENVWFSSAKKLFTLKADGSFIEHSLEQCNTSKEGAYLQFAEENGDVWVYRNGFMVIYNLNLNTIRCEKLNFRPDYGSQVKSVKTSDGRTWYTSRVGLVVKDEDDEKLARFVPNSGTVPHHVNSFLEEKDGSFWMSSLSNGLTYFAALDLCGDQSRQYLNDKRVSKIMKDQEGNLWFSSMGSGVYFITQNAKSVQNITLEDGLADPQIHRVWVDSMNEKLWIGTANAHIHTYQNQVLDTILNNLDGSYFRITDIVQLPNKSLVFATENGLYMYQQSILKKVSTIPSSLKSLYLENEEYLWIGGASFAYKLPVDSLLGLNMNIDANIRLGDYGIYKGRVHSIVADGNGNAWMGNNAGLMYYNGAAKAIEKSEHPMLQFSIADMHLQKEDNLLWIATYGGGIMVKQGEKVQNISTDNGLIGNVCNQIHFGEDGIWVATNQGVAKISGYDFQSNTFEIQHFNRSDGLLSDEINSIYTLGSKVYAASSRGVSIFDEATIHINNVPPKVYITNISIGEKDTTLVEKLDLAYDENNLKIDFVGLSYQSDQQITYFYKMKNLDVGWLRTEATSVQYPALPSGNYQFEVYAMNKSGIRSNNTASFGLEINVPIWRTWWFRALIGMIVIAVLYLWLKMNLSEKQRKRLSVMVAEKTMELKQNVQELKRSNKKLEEFAYIASHDLKEPLRTVASYVQLLEYRYKEKLDDNALEYIEFAVKGVKRMQVLIDDLLRFSVIDRSAYNPHTIDLNETLSSVLDELSDFTDIHNAEIRHAYLPKIVADPQYMQQLFQNLINNAIKFNKSAVPIVEVNYQERSADWLFSIKDNGIGIEQDYKDKVFVMFQQLHSIDQFSGTGIGLTICKRIVEKHDGEIWIESEPEKGTTVFFTIKKQYSNVERTAPSAA